MSLTDLSTLGPNEQWRMFWDADSLGDRWYVGMNTDATGAPSFVYGYNTGQNTGVKYAPGIPTTEQTALPGSGVNQAAGTFTVIVPTSAVGSPAAGTTLPDVQGRTFAGQGNVTTASSNLAIDTTGFGSYTLVANSYCTG
jgi:hypothetical protein